MRRISILLIVSIVVCACASVNQFIGTTISAQNEQLISRGKNVSASSYWKNGELAFLPESIIDGRTDENISCTDIITEGHTYWLLAEKQIGWVEIDLGKEYLITKVRWINTHNGLCQDRATTDYHIVISKTRNYSKDGSVISKGTMELETNPEFQEVKLPRQKQGRYVRFYVDGFSHGGGGLNELEIYGIE
jgi:hypothetical protein